MNDHAQSILARERFALVGRVGLGVTVMVGLVLIAVMASLDRIDGSGYVQVLGSLAAGRENLLPALCLSGAILLAVAGLLTWLVARYVSFRVAGPLYRFMCNVDAARTGLGATHDLRRGDLLQQESRKLLDAIASVDAYQIELHALANRAARAVDGTCAADPIEVRDALAALRDMVHRARL